MPLIPVPHSENHAGVKITVLNKDGSESEAWTLDGSVQKTLHVADAVWADAHKVVSQFVGHSGKVDPKCPQEVLKDVQVPTPTPVGQEPAIGPAADSNPVGTGANARKGNEPSKRFRQTRQPQAKPVEQPTVAVTESPAVVTDAVVAEVTPAPPAEEKADEKAE